MSVKIIQGGAVLKTAEPQDGDNLLKLLGRSGVFLDAPCGGLGKCGKCKVRLSSGGEEVRACQTPADGVAEVHIPGEMKMEIAGDDGQIIGGGQSKPGRLGVAIDVGTTTVVAHLTDMDSGARLASASGVNAQRPYGADVVSRIEFSAEYGHERLSALITEQINGLIAQACAKSGSDSRDIELVVIAGNTIMQHLAAGYSPVGMGTVPFRPVSLFGEFLPPWQGLPAGKDARVYYCPCVSSYVGGDITAGMLACGLEDDPGPTVFIDIGTNGEIAMKLGDKYYCCATAAGPAFEGAEISCGMAAVNGAVSHVNWDEESGKLRTTVLGEAAPQGFCGSGLLDALSMLLITGAVDETGRMLSSEEIEHPIREHIGKLGGETVFFLDREREVYLSSRDVRKLQLAKSAIASGIQTLLITAGVANAQVRSFVLAGGFGSYMDKFSAAKIGLFPAEFLPITRSLGNTAGEGAAIALTQPDRRAVLERIDDKCEYIELSTSPIFNDEFVENMMFE
ncbi:MAG: ASKHA domain-containing protein [Oscillospiraceae bacterium]|jgi:uncharacterized 2Fe-2S/4Fe-4S cluster protein (DUF4445 family)|nr:ASKHA domain-containing protein [Oscillospiraceae bacterium]